MSFAVPPMVESTFRPLTNREMQLQSYRQIRQTTLQICRPLEREDFVVQSMPDVSPPKWHLAHTSWFFETFILEKVLQEYRTFHPDFHYLFNSYYKGIGRHHPRAERGLLSRPNLETVYQYRAHVDDHMIFLLESSPQWEKIQGVLELGLHHEQQHQELLLTDIKHIFFKNPLRPAYHEIKRQWFSVPPLEWKEFPEGLVEIGHDGTGFSFDNERPRHRTFVETFRLGSRLVTNGEYKAFIEDGGYRKALLWLSDGWDLIQREKSAAPLYWEKREDEWWQWTLAGMQPVAPDEPVCHLSYYEADAYARWMGKRLPTEAEWEWAASRIPLEGNFFETGNLRPLSAELSSQGLPSQMFGDTWEWTQSPYVPYPGFQPTGGELGEYNGKFMCNQMVLRGGSCFSSQSHIRTSYRNFFPPHSRWQCSGIRLAENVP